MARLAPYIHKGKTVWPVDVETREAVIWSYDIGKRRREYHVQTVIHETQETISHVVFSVRRKH